MFFKNIKRENEKLKEVIISLEEERKNLKNNIAAIIEDSDNLIAALEEKTKSIEVNKKETAKLKKEVATLKEVIEKYKSIITCRDKELDNTRNTINKLNNQLLKKECQRRKSASKIGGYTRQRNLDKKVISQLNEEKRTMQQIINDLEKEKLKLKRHLEPPTYVELLNGRRNRK